MIKYEVYLFDVKFFSLPEQENFKNTMTVNYLNLTFNCFQHRFFFCNQDSLRIILSIANYLFELSLHQIDIRLNSVRSNCDKCLLHGPFLPRS